MPDKPKNSNLQYRDERRKIEFKRIFSTEMRAEQSEGKRILTGHAAVFDQETSIGGYFREVLRKGCFKKTIQEYDQAALWDHETGKPLGRRSAQTLELAEDDTGLFFRIFLGEQSWANDAWISIQRGDVSGMSFSFRATPGKVIWTLAQNPSDDLREIFECMLYEISPVTFPAYEGTDVSAQQARAIKGDAVEKKLLSRTEFLIATCEPGAHHSETSEPDERHHSEAGTKFDIRMARAKHRQRTEMQKFGGQ